MNARPPFTPRAAAALLCAVCLTAAPARAGAGASAFPLLKLGTSADGAALADATGARAAGATAPASNPAGLLAPLRGNPSAQIMLTHREWIQDTRIDHLAAAVRLGDAHALGFSLQNASVPDIEIRTRPGPADGTFSARAFTIGLSYAHTPAAGLRLGATARMLYQKILVDDAAGFGVDLGAQYETAIPGLTTGLVLANLGTGGTFRSETSTLPTLLRAGAAYATPLDDWHPTLVADLVHVFPDSRSLLNLGAEVRFQDAFAARGGYQFGSEGRSFTAGIGLAQGILSLDYAYVPFSDDLGHTHTITLAVNL